MFAPAPIWPALSVTRLARWIQNPQKALSGNAMPQMSVTPEEARDITAFLYTLE